MRKSLKYREVVGDARRIVVKIGSRVLVQKSGRPDVRRMRPLTRQIADLRKQGYEVVVVTSGAIGAGMQALKMCERPTTLPDLQMAAAVGQTRLMSKYGEMFSSYGYKIGQVLLTHQDFHHKIRLSNARRTMENMLRKGVIPIVNENDVVADEEIRADLALGDNDLLASLLVKLIRSDLLVMLTTVDGLRKPGKSGHTRRIRYVEAVNRKTLELAGSANSSLSKGGMYSKLKAAQAAAKVGCSVIIANGRQDQVLKKVMRGEDVGTIVLASGI
ncbi:MAG: glutamate 5-kinase [Verrucomicrobiota bacterium]